MICSMSGIDQILSDNGCSYIATDLAEWLDEKGMDHLCGAPYHPQTHGKTELSLDVSLLVSLHIGFALSSVSRSELINVHDSIKTRRQPNW